jgi:hypothetical protein
MQDEVSLMDDPDGRTGSVMSIHDVSHELKGLELEIMRHATQPSLPTVKSAPI